MTISVSIDLLVFTTLINYLYVVLLLAYWTVDYWNNCWPSDNNCDKRKQQAQARNGFLLAYWTIDYWNNCWPSYNNFEKREQQAQARNGFL